ncbi:MAG: hypothetical protein M1825_004137 [Sarcosagium campestre]|nr:MAG: hypothetical protein M1825_004137 [Sarcosagium campestre]
MRSRNPRSKVNASFNTINGLSQLATLSQPSEPLPSSEDVNRPPLSSPPPSAVPDADLIGPEASSSSTGPPPFSSIDFSPSAGPPSPYLASISLAASPSLTAYAPASPFDDRPSSSAVAVAETKDALPRDNKGEPSSKSKSVPDGEPPPPYTEGSSPLQSFTYLMAAAGGASSIITQVQQGGGQHLNTLQDVGSDENINLDLRGTHFTLSRDELFTLPEFVLLSLFPSGLPPDGQMNSFHEGGDVYPVDYDPASLQYMLDFFRTVAQTIPSRSPSPTGAEQEGSAAAEPPAPGSARDMLQDRAGIIVLREDLDFYAIPPFADIEQPEMVEVKRAAGSSLLKQNGIFSGLRRSDETGTTEQHLIEMLTAGGFDPNSRWGHRASEPNKAVICSLALARLRTDVKTGTGAGADPASNAAVGMAQKLLLFWRKPARRCWWEGVELSDVEGLDRPLKVWIRRVWTLEMVSITPLIPLSIEEIPQLTVRLFL